MYSKNVIEKNVKRMSKLLGFALEYHSIAQVEAQNRHLDELLDNEGRLRRPLSSEEIQWITNERMLCKLDFRYFSTRYVFVKHFSEPKIVRFVPNVAQEVVLMIWAELEEERKPIEIQQLKARQLGMCLEENTGILTADLRWIPIKDAAVGQELVALDEFPPGGRGASRRMCTSVVLAKREVTEEAFLIRLENGHKIIATGEHRFLVKNGLTTFAKCWKRVNQLKLGNCLRFVTPPWGESSLEDAWFGGLLDGEGSLRARKEGGVEICVSQVENEVLERAHKYLQDRGYTFHLDTDNRKGSEGSSKHGDRPVYKLVLNRINEVFRLIGTTRPTRFIGKKWWEGKELPGKHRVMDETYFPWSKIISIEAVGVKRAIDLQTTSGTFFAAGFVSHNSTLTEIAVAHRTQFYTHVNSVVASSDPDKSALMAQMMELCWEKQPWWLLPRQSSYRQGLYIEFGDMNSRVSIQHGTQFTGIGRGATPNTVHLSELADYDNPEDIVDAGLLRAIHPSRWTFLVFESTASGRRNWWHRTWEYSKENWKTGRARLYPMFLPWFIGRDIYPTETWIYSHPIPANWEPSQLTLHHAERAEAYVRANEYLSRILGKEWSLPIEQMWYWEVTRDEYAAKKELAQFYSEMPADDLEAFQSTNTSAFDADTLTEYREYTRTPMAVYGFIGSEKDIPKRMQPDRREIDPNQKIVTITANWNPSIEKFSCQLVPLKFNGYPGFDPLGKLLVWEWPEENEVYGLGIDTGDGVGLDRSTIECLRKGSLEKNDAQVAEFASAYINSRDLWPLCMAVGTLFSPRINGEVHQARMAIDCLRNGENVQFELQKRGWWNHHPWLRYDKRRVRVRDANKLGVFSNSWFRSMMMDDITKAIRDQWIDLNSPYLIDEMADLERDDVRQSMKACYGANDDRIIALAQIHFSLHILEIRGSEQSLSAERVGRRESESVDPVYSSGYQDNDKYRNWSTREELENRVSRWNE